MGKSVNMPEAYDLDELLDKNVKLNRFDASNPFGTQNWTQLPDGRWSLDQEIAPEMQQALDNQFAYANAPSKQLNMMEHMAPGMEMLGGALAQRAGIGELPGMGSKAGMVTEAPMPALPSGRTKEPKKKRQPYRPDPGDTGDTSGGGDGNERGDTNRPNNPRQGGPVDGPGGHRDADWMADFYRSRERNFRGIPR